MVKLSDAEYQAILDNEKRAISELTRMRAELYTAEQQYTGACIKLAEAEEDSERLTWVIEQSNAGNGWLDDGVWDSAPYIEDCDDVQIIIRAAIDAARKEKP